MIAVKRAAWLLCVLASAGCVEDVWLGPEQRVVRDARDAVDAAPDAEAATDAGVTEDAAAPDDASAPEDAAVDASPPDDAGDPSTPAFCGIGQCLFIGAVPIGCTEETPSVCWPVAGNPVCQPTCAPAARCGRPGDAPCAADELCLLSIDGGTCGENARGGYCAPYPKSCAGERPFAVCGCDGRTYATQCAAAQSGVSQAHEGPCNDVDAGA